MAINKVINKSTKSHGAMKNVLGYVLRDDKVTEGYVEYIGPYPPESKTINRGDVYNSFIEEKKYWGKDSGRMYSHNIISFHERENITPKQCLEIGTAFSEEFFPGHQCLIAVHQDKGHLHCHIVTNTVSFIDGHKLHQTKYDLQRQKEFTNKLCIDRNLSIAEKGKHFDGTPIEQGEITAWNKDKYNLLINDSRKSFVTECGLALMEVIPCSASREEFISGMQERGWDVRWEDKRKHIVFQNENGDKVRDSNIEKTFTEMKINKEDLLHEFERHKELRLKDYRDIEAEREREAADLKRYYAEIESAAKGLDTSKTVRDDSGAVSGDPETTDSFGRVISGAKLSKAKRETGRFLKDLNAGERASEEKRDNSISERQDREAERRRLDSEKERAAREREQRIIFERAECKRRSRSYDIER